MPPGLGAALAVARARVAALAISVTAAAVAFQLFMKFGAADGLDNLDLTRAGLILISTWWLAWGAAQGLMGLTTRAAPPRVKAPPHQGRAIVLVPVYNEDPMVTFARIAAMEASLQAARAARGGAEVHFAILSDTRNTEIAALEQIWFLRLLAETGARGRIFYRRRTDNTGKKAGNIEEFITRSGAAYDYAVILDADSLMEGETILEMLARMEAEPRLGLLQTLPKVVRAQTLFGRAMQFSAAFYSPVFARGLAMMQGRSGPFWGHNAAVRVRAFAESCGLPALAGKPPFGGHILSHDYVEAALLARAGWTVRLDDDLEGSFEEGPENIVDHAKRDRRWCQGNLQHARLLAAPRLKLWSRFVFVQGIFAYVAPLFWLGFILVSIVATVTAPPPDYFPTPYWPFPVFPADETSKAIGLFIGIIGLLILPKALIAFDAAASGRAAGFGGGLRAALSTLSELVLSSITAPVFLMYQTRAVLQVLMGRDGGWPTNNRGDGTLSLRTALVAGRWISAWGLAGGAATWIWAPGLVPWLSPVVVPMVLAPLILWATARPWRGRLFTTPFDRRAPAIVAAHDAVLTRWEGLAAQGAVLPPLGTQTAAVPVQQEDADAPARGISDTGAPGPEASQNRHDPADAPRPAEETHG
ncbi:glucans biosynthesis glucosyltransferase MdoH [Phaeovulum vinaykumarii]|uniref:Glucans biosynthesis glucosyltransferase H n=1 Tax=Phaeovulum vinaykumarii TaxID=407234 RepID=A0A1N7M1M5_9RHOB|nr:glucans biosynthesis glucosyltransferase MdoH [Phaeovulum vinaykumarii]SIS79984.1 membrane glycosyltransferase [Phaeovulum vinaykumarii]SOC09462.1 membrane glycosyltransferase [Phaeovulum vinaykumarii]